MDIARDPGQRQPDRTFPVDACSSGAAPIVSAPCRHDGDWLDPELQTFSAATGLKISPRASHTTTVLTDGRVLFAGGRSAGQPAELWDERTGQVTIATTDRTLVRMGHEAMLQADGRVRLIGGSDASGRPTQLDVLFDPQAMTFHVEPHRAVSTPTTVALAASLPAAQTQDVSLDARLALRFNQPLRMADLNSASLTLIGPEGVSQLRVNPAEGGRLVFATPHQQLFPDSKYTLPVSGARAATGQPLPLTAVDFHTRMLPAPVGATAPPAASNNGSAAQASLATDKTTANCASSVASMLPCQATASLRDGVWTPGSQQHPGSLACAGAISQTPRHLMGGGVVRC